MDLLDGEVELTKIDEVQGEGIDLMPEVLCCERVDRETCKTSGKVTIHKLQRK